MSFTTEHVVRTEGYLTWYQCPGCACVLPGKTEMNFHRLRSARCHRFDVNAKPFFSQDHLKRSIKESCERHAAREIKTLSDAELLEHADRLLEDIEDGDLYETCGWSDPVTC